MNKIEKLIEKLCPEGVEFKELGEILYFRNGKGHEKHIDNKGKYIVVNSKFVSTEGSVKKYSKTQICPIFTDDILMVMSDLPNGKALAKCYLVMEDNKYTLNQRICSLTVKDRSYLLPKFYYYILNRNKQLLRYDNGSDQTNLRKSNILKIKAPIPPLPIQEEIVAILDKFTQLEAELEAELEARKTQYEHYRDELLSFENGVEVKSISEICHINRGRVMSKDYLRDNAGSYPVYSSQTANKGVFGLINTYDYDFESVTWTTDGANAGSIFYHNNEKFSITNVCGLLKIKDDISILTKFLYYVLGFTTKIYVSEGMGNPKLMSNAMSRIQIPIPPLPIQEEIVAILDKFDALVNDISVGLPAEIEARRKQYEHYREKLLTFPELRVEN